MKIAQHHLFLCAIVMFAALGINAQQLTQTIRGHVVEAESKFPLLGAVVTVYTDTTLINGATTDDAGNFFIAKIPTGRVRIKCEMIGYAEYILDNVELSSAKELVLNIELQQSVAETEIVEITATREGEAMNEMATVSSRQFSVNETDRYAGSRGDPARMASNFAGVQGADDSRNDIVIRGNSPQGVLWRMEGIDIPNPNHFNIPGTAGGPVSIINNKYLANSDFYTGAFPADYGNSVAGVFDLRMRNGNNQKHEFSGQFGFLGTELFAEGPITPLLRRGAGGEAKGSSYIASYRYSTIELFSKLGIDIGTDAVPRYQDGAFRFFFPGKKNSSLAVWGVGGKSSVDILISNQTTPDQRNIYGENDRDQYFKTHMGVLGVTYHKTFSEKTFFKTTVAAMTDQVDSYHELVSRHLDENNRYVVDSLKPLLDYTFTQSRISVGSSINYKINRKVTWRSGINVDYYFWNHVDSVRVLDTAAVNYNQWETRWNSKDKGTMIQPYTQVKWRPNDKWTLTMGLHNSIFSILKKDLYPTMTSMSIAEPRLGIKYDISKNQSISFGIGKHSQMQPAYMYFYENAAAIPECPVCDQVVRPQINRSMGLTKSDHVVLSYQIMIKKNIRVLSEAYFQQMYDIPVDGYTMSSFSMVNSGSGFSRVFPGGLANKGKAKNYGMELTVEKFFSKNWLFLFTASVFESKYAGSDGVWRNTDFNGKYAVNALISKEWKVNENSRITTGTKITTAGGRWYGPADIAASNAARELVFIDSLRNTQQFAPYFRWDIKLNYTVNRKKVAHNVGLDLVNVLNTKNILKLTYAPDESNDPNTAVRKEYQLGFLPVFFYKIDF
jgi:Carboxypeptidase regulatory-like domain